MKLHHATILIVFTLFLFGCSQSASRLSQPTVSSDAGAAAIQKYDGNKDGAISADELASSPGLKIALSRIDTNKDGKITAEEISSRIDQWRASRLALSSMNVRLRLDGRPLQNATMTLVPEEFLGPAVKTASGTSDNMGYVNVCISPDPDENGVHLGFYRVTISKQDNGKETIPSRYNEKSELGIEVAHDLDTQNFGIDLRSQ
ncbi:MAG: hypothetical protein IT427_11265 [Pirellulales bacterium]|nr:hypothetical protein [Pirellulales bacterium]